MTKITLILLILLITGCTTAERHTFINPSEYLYHKGNNHYEAKEFNQAIDKYQEFLKGNERSSLAIPAQLNLGMSYYYSGDYVNAYTMLSKTTLKDPNLKKYTNSIIEECRSYAGDEIANLTQATPTTKETKKDPAETISITITDAFINNFGSLVVTGQTNMPTTIFVDNKSATADSKNKFTISAPSWKRGRSVAITADDNNGNSGQLNYFPDSEPPDEPNGLYVSSQTSNSMEIRWDRNDEKDIQGYKLYYRLQGGSTIEINEIIKDTDYEIVGLERKVDGGNRTFEFYLRAVDKMNNESGNSDILEAELPL